MLLFWVFFIRKLRCQSGFKCLCSILQSEERESGNAFIEITLAWVAVDIETGVVLAAVYVYEYVVVVAVLVVELVAVVVYVHVVVYWDVHAYVLPYVDDIHNEMV